MASPVPSSHMSERLQPSQPYPASTTSATIGNFAAYHRVPAGATQDGGSMAPSIPARIAESSEFQRFLSAHNVKALPLDLQHPGAAAALMDQASAIAARLAGGEWGAPPAAGSASPQGNVAPHASRGTRINENLVPAAQQSHSPSQILRATQQYGSTRTHSIPELPEVCLRLPAAAIPVHTTTAVLIRHLLVVYMACPSFSILLHRMSLDCCKLCTMQPARGIAHS